MVSSTIVQQDSNTTQVTDRAETDAFSFGARQIAIMIGVGLIAGFLSGLFGIGGGTIIVPALVLCGMTQRNAAATSLAAIVRRQSLA